MKQINPEQLERNVLEFGKQIFEEVSTPSKRLLDTQYYIEKLLEWGMKDEEFKVSLFRFVDVLPSLHSAASVIRHVQEYFDPLEQQIPGLLRKGLNLSPTSVSAKIVAPTIRKQIRFIGERFIVGETPKQALSALKRIRKKKMAFTVDLVGEAVVSEVEAQTYLDRYIELLSCLSQETGKWSEKGALIAGHRGEDSPINISVKLSALYSQHKPVAADKTISMFVERLSQIMSEAKKVGAFVNVDMEDSSLTTITLEAFKRTLEREEFRDYDRSGIVLQTYLRRTRNDLEALLAWVRKREVPLAIRLVKGAYWDTETILATQRDWPIPVWQHKPSSDAEYEKLTQMLFEHNDLIYPAFASHNIRSLCYAIKMAEQLGLQQTDFELQTLYGMGDQIKSAFVNRGYLVREYAPIGELIPAMGYLVRRLLENTANEGFLRASFHENETPETLLQKPSYKSDDSGTEHINDNIRARFSNNPLRDYTMVSNREKLSQAISDLRTKVKEEAQTVLPIVSGIPRDTQDFLPSICPEDKAVEIARVGLADISLAKEALLELEKFFPIWRATSVHDRCEILFKTAEILERDRERITAAIVLETGKAWTEADGDIAEAIDFLYYYGHEALRLSKTVQLGKIPGENNSYFYEPRGIALIVSPWNFPLAIPCGMFSAALVTGNCAILKPAGQSSYIAQLLFEAFLEAGLPAEAAAFLPGKGREIGAYLADHPLVSTIVFTGSKEVGLELIRKGATHHSGAEHVKRVIAEMGGKNAVIIDEDANLDEAVKGVVYAAFGYQGQKCSACSRAIVVGNATYERFTSRLSEAIRSLTIGPVSDPATFVGPVIDAAAYKSIREIIESSRSNCSTLAEGNLSEELKPKGFFINPIAFTDIPEKHELLSKEIFGPVLAVLQVPDFKSAIALACDSEYGLTGGVFSRSPKNIETAVREFRVGNLYINRSCTGAKVYLQPFGGAKMSGVGSKAGGPDYLLQFLIPRTVTENSMRRGFAPLD